MKSILVIGSSNTDMVITSPELPMPGETILGGEFFMNAGGKGANQAVAAVRMGAEVTLLAKVGMDVFGEQAVTRFQEEGIQTQYVLRDPDLPSGVALIMVDEHGENLISVAPGANADLRPEDIQAQAAAIRKAGILLLQLETPMATVSAAMKMAAAARKLIILNPAPAAVLSEELLSNVTILTPNEHEAGMLSGVPVTDVSSAKEAASRLRHAGAKTVIITMGALGVLLATEEGSMMIPAPEVNVVDTTAAGDTFNGALAACLARGDSLDQAVRTAVMAASISVTRSGAQASCPFLSELSF